MPVWLEVLFGTTAAIGVLFAIGAVLIPQVNKARARRKEREANDYDVRDSFY